MKNLKNLFCSTSLVIALSIQFGMSAEDDMSRACPNGFCVETCPIQFNCPPCPPCQNCIPTCILSGSFTTNGTAVTSQSGSNFIVTIAAGNATVLFSPFSTIVAPTVSSSTGAAISLQGAPTTKSFTFGTIVASTTYYFVVTPAT